MELTFSSGSVTDILGKLLKDSNSENNNDTQHDDNHSNKLKDPSKYPLSFKHSSLDELLVILKEHLLSPLYLKHD